MRKFRLLAQGNMFDRFATNMLLRSQRSHYAGPYTTDSCPYPQERGEGRTIEMLLNDNEG